VDRIWTILGIIVAVLYVVLILAGIVTPMVTLMEPAAIILVGIGVITGR
jgi:hypothetical protein